MFRGSLIGWGVLGRMDTCVCMAESLHYSPETITQLLISQTPIEKKKVFFFNVYYLVKNEIMPFAAT